MKSYFHSIHRPETGLAYNGITLIPPESLSLFYEAVVSSEDYKTSNELSNLASKILEAFEDTKHMIPLRCLKEILAEDTKKIAIALATF
ncbi:hypothetical protein F7984_05760 [Pradoshia sp. D12]|uniref:hypothetical protein n=1 Tax=Bacillaceae TaxID=186817 RepID=UPI001129F04C|nr:MULTISPECIES: hypothetical protein [Bacillaceae]QFK70782.1 hypothetical protein F7984_05760 [Pradoshia sp. D12]TPF72573.1 hypothetical protein FHY44_02145 [Bacillus sp. D12]